MSDFISYQLCARAHPLLARAWAALAIFPALLSARELPPIDAFGQSVPVRRSTAAHFASGPLASFHGRFDERLDVPAFLIARPGAVRQSGASLLPVSDATGVARSFLKSLADAYRIAPADVDALPVTGTQRLPNGGAIVQFGNSVNGIEVFRERASVLVNADGALNSIGGYVSSVGTIANGNVRALFRHGAADAVATALQDFEFPAAATRGALHSSGAKDGYEYLTLTDRSASGHTLAQPARAKPVFFRMTSGVVPAWYVEIHAVSSIDADDSSYAYVVSAKDESVLYRQNLTQQDAFAYRVWAEVSPSFLPYPGPSGRNGVPYATTSPNGYQAPFIAPNLVSLANAVPVGSVAANDPWLPNGATQTSGNNVDAYADLVAPDGFSAGDLRASTTGANTFDRIYDTTLSPQSSQTQEMAAITQLFYLNNWMHDWYYDAGFDEASGNAQQNNFGRGGFGGDPLLAEAQDYSGINNSNMNTPADGSSPRMQMYTFTGPVTAGVTVSGTLSASYKVGLAAFGPTTFNTTAAAVAYASPAIGCTAISNVNLQVALIDRGVCPFKTKAANAQAAGAVAVLIANNAAGDPQSLPDGAPAGPLTIPVLSLSLADGNAIKAALPGVNASLQRIQQVDRDGTIDSMIVAHEWGHYISARLGSGVYAAAMGAGMGEGYADFHALLMTVKAGDALVAANTNFAGTYAMSGYVTAGFFSQLAPESYYYGIRRYPYSTDTTKNPLTFKYIQDSEVLPASPAPSPASSYSPLNSEFHNTGEVWASMLWECYASLLRDTPRLSFVQAQDRMKRYLVGSYKLLPVAPTLLDGRDALLAMAYANDTADYQDCAGAFAKRGAGVGAVSPDGYSNNEGVIESFVANGAVGDWTSATLSDAGGSCDNDGALDSLESGKLTLQLHNSGFAALNSTLVDVDSPNLFVTLPSPQLIVPAIPPYGSAVVPVPIDIGNVAGIQTMTLNYAASDPALVNLVSGQLLTRINYDLVAGKTEDFEKDPLAWIASSPDFVSADALWQRVDDGSGNHVAFGPDVGAQGLTYLASPPMQVSSAPLTITFKHNYSFESSDGVYWDGGVVEVTQNGGATWTDVTLAGGTLSPTYNGIIGDLSAFNPLKDRLGYVDTSGPGFTTVTLSFGTALAGKTVQLRFAVGSDEAQGAAGWQIDDVTASGISNNPFTHAIPDPGHCQIDRVFRSGFDK